MTAAERALRIGLLHTKHDRRFKLTVEADAFLPADETHDRARAAWLIARVVRQADDLEQALFPGQDSPYHLVEHEPAEREPEGPTHAA